MWILLFVSLSGAHGDMFLERYVTLEECQKDRDRVAQEMQISYPTDLDMSFVCRFHARQAQGGL